jgi:hypothetical protein
MNGETARSRSQLTHPTGILHSAAGMNTYGSSSFGFQGGPNQNGGHAPHFAPPAATRSSGGTKLVVLIVRAVLVVPILGVLAARGVTGYLAKSSHPKPTANALLA